MMYTHNEFATFTSDMEEYCNHYVDREALLYIMLANEILHEIHPNIVTIAEDIIGCIHSLNVIFLIIETALNRLPFTWFGIIYFVLWSGAYVVFQWVLHASYFTWWPYPFLDLSTPLAPLWYLGLALVHIPCYGLYVLLTKAKHVSLSRMFPKAFVRSI
ncbi:1 4-alpha-glucan-branching enzyme 3 chloroplastic/amyloplastic [Phtheirospermum japonicum]|uniref:1 4-alpha-glucan-branching enzyme 3 chloroplastic/amyloplastic n=1 Tax=Phtheirospermum japonicum TaxID=374723 RepID=A0A830BSY9_9LAMI|nr:1 4-alpha-glucan-branching enzyme 3 chloroplastic/amyloplastic [Phtheirospermum japonicum]